MSCVFITGEGLKYNLPDLLPLSEEQASGSDTAVQIQCNEGDWLEPAQDLDKWLTFGEEIGPIITQALVQAALKDTRPSLSPSEKYKYQKIEEERNTQEEIISTHLLFSKLSYMYEFTFLVLEAELFNLCLLINVSCLDTISTTFHRKENEPLHYTDSVDANIISKDHRLWTYGREVCRLRPAVPSGVISDVVADSHGRKLATMKSKLIYRPIVGAEKYIVERKLACLGELIALLTLPKRIVGRCRTGDDVALGSVVHCVSVVY
ncbi:unnamed protein product, partial [Timema podura]|nr:unnamed protein product [Timema podura]